MEVLQTDDLRQRPGEVLDAAVVEPQFVFRAGRLFMIAPVEPGPGVRNLPEGFFAYPPVLDPERLALEERAAQVPQSPER
jgi:hypothetical protein